MICNLVNPGRHIYMEFTMDLASLLIGIGTPEC